VKGGVTKGEKGGFTGNRSKSREDARGGGMIDAYQISLNNMRRRRDLAVLQR